MHHSQRSLNRNRPQTRNIGYPQRMFPVRARGFNARFSRWRPSIQFSSVMRKTHSTKSNPVYTNRTMENKQALIRMYIQELCAVIVKKRVLYIHSFPRDIIWCCVVCVFVSVYRNDLNCLYRRKEKLVQSRAIVHRPRARNKTCMLFPQTKPITHKQNKTEWNE